MFVSRTIHIYSLLILVFIIFIDICADCANAKAKIMSNYESLMKIRADAILPGLFAKGVITSENKQIIDAKILDWEKMRYLIDNIIIQSLDVGIITTYKEFLNVLERNDDRIINTIAQRLGEPYTDSRCYV